MIMQSLAEIFDAVLDDQPNALSYENKIPKIQIWFSQKEKQT